MYFCRQRDKDRLIYSVPTIRGQDKRVLVGINLSLTVSWPVALVGLAKPNILMRKRSRRVYLRHSVQFSDSCRLPLATVFGDLEAEDEVVVVFAAITLALAIFSSTYYIVVFRCLFMAPL